MWDMGGPSPCQLYHPEFSKEQGMERVEKKRGSGECGGAGETYRMGANQVRSFLSLA